MQYFHVGADPVGQEVLVGSDNKIYKRLNRCPCCGTPDALSSLGKIHSEEVCVDCSKHYAQCVSGKSRLNNSSSRKSLETYIKNLHYFVDLRMQGGFAPDWIDQQIAWATWRLSTLPKPKPAYVYKSGRCYYCGNYSDKLLLASKTRKRCPKCAQRYNSYRQLAATLHMLSVDECTEFNNLLHEYRDLMLTGYWAPDIQKYRRLIRKRLAKLAEEDNTHEDV